MKILRGEQPKRINRNEAVPPEADETPPDHLDLVAQEQWHEILPVLKTMRIFTQADRSALAMYCSLYSRWMWAKSELQLQGELWRLKTGLYQVNPYMKTELDCISKMLAIMEQFPSSGDTLRNSSDASYRPRSSRVPPRQDRSDQCKQQTLTPLRREDPLGRY